MPVIPDDFFLWCRWCSIPHQSFTRFQEKLAAWCGFFYYDPIVFAPSFSYGMSNSCIAVSLPIYCLPITAISPFDNGGYPGSQSWRWHWTVWRAHGAFDSVSVELTMSTSTAQKTIKTTALEASNILLMRLLGTPELILATPSCRGGGLSASSFFQPNNSPHPGA